ncbi:glycosyltransferase family 39 protein [Nocardia sp. N2S4-5]|uniref:glycosyltransferase family 39 protein n=1 Tax=Nocardia sp. N2S4-5 TaxID=3351565 RepID=UPI0037D0CE87
MTARGLSVSRSAVSGREVGPGTAWWRGSRGEWACLAVLLLGTAVAYFWNLTANGYANSFYTAAVQAGSKSWESLLFGSSDWANSITVDKTPAALWPMEISARVFGFSSGSVLAPQVVLGVASVALLWATIRRSFGAAAGLLSGLVLAVTPIAALMFRFNNPDALLVLLMIAAVWAMTHAVEDGRWRWLVLCGTFVGFGFLAKQLQVLLVLPALALIYLFAGPPKLGKRIAQLLAAGAAMIVAAGWWVLVAQLWPADSRPYFGGSKHNSIIELTLGYNGLDRISSSGGGSLGGPGFGHDAGIVRLFTASVGGQVAWLIPAALVLLLAGIALRGKASRTDGPRAVLLMFGVWGLVTGLVFSFMTGIFHQYYTVALAPAIAGVVGAGSIVLWRERERWWVRVALALSVTLTAVTSWVFLSRTPDFVSGLRWVALAVGVLAAVAMLWEGSRKLTIVTVLAAASVGLAGPVAYTAHTLATAHTGPIPLAGPSAGSDRHDGVGGPPAGGPAGAGPGGDMAFDEPDGDIPADGRQAGRPGPGGPPVGFTPSDAMVTVLEQNGGSYTWALATIGSGTAADYQLAIDLPVMAIGGFSGGDPSPTLQQFRDYVARSEIHYFIPSAIRGGPGSSSDSSASQITQWVEDHYDSTRIDGVTVYDLTAPRI